MRKLALLAVLVSLAGCNNYIFDGEVRRAVREELTDPDSAVFKGEVIHKDFACIQVNARNSYGGMTGFRTVILEQGYRRYFVKKWGGWKCDIETLKPYTDVKPSPAP